MHISGLSVSHPAPCCQHIYTPPTLFFANIPRTQAEDERTRGIEEGQQRSGNSSNDGANGDDGGGPKGEAFQLSSSRGRRVGEGLAGQQGACCA